MKVEYNNTTEISTIPGHESISKHTILRERGQTLCILLEPINVLNNLWIRKSG